MFKRQSLQALGYVRPTCTPAVRTGGIRCMSETRPQAEEAGSSIKAAMNKSTPNNTGRTRQQRASQVSEQVRALNRTNESSVNGQSSTGGQKSRYVSTNRQGSRPQDGAPRPHGGAPRPHGGAPRPQGGAPGFNRRPNQAGNYNRNNRVGGGAGNRTGPPGLAAAQQPGARALEEEATQEEDEEDENELESPSTQHELVLLEQFDKQDITPVPFEHEAVTKEEYLKLGQGGATIAAGNFEGVIEDRLRLLAEPTQDGFRWAPDMAKRMLKGGFVSFQSEEEKSAVIAAAAKITEAANKPAQTFAPVAKSSQDALFDKLVRGSYPDPKATPHKQQILNDVVRNTLRNSTYLADDQAKLLKKIRSLLPAEVKKPAAAAGAPKAKAKTS